ncbi:MAG: N-formylglutamate amidohydrolase [Flavobacteriaceae bacterium]|nr:N-formylglutamate amidohydrolase [Flavobacteriaceae bacterium]
MQKLSINKIIKKIQSEETFEAVSDDYSFTIKIDKYVPFICGAVHDGHQFRKSLWGNCLHTEYERWFEEDPSTKQMIQTFPIVIAGCDSRFEYDLNRAPESAIYTDAWGKQLWKNPLPKSEKRRSLQKHANFYKVVHALVSKIEEKFGVAVVYDMHSYNWKRWNREVPTFNIGAGKVDNKRFGNDVELWREMLSEIKLPNGIESTSLINDTFQGNGYFLGYITQNFKNTLVLATEVKKIYCDEYKQINFPEVVSAIEAQLKVLLFDHATSFYNKHRTDS